MNKWQVGLISAAITVGLALGIGEQALSQMNAWKSGKNNNRLIQIQNDGGVQADSGKVEIAYFSNSAFRVTSPPRHIDHG